MNPNTDLHGEEDTGRSFFHKYMNRHDKEVNLDEYRYRYTLNPLRWIVRQLRKLTKEK